LAISVPEQSRSSNILIQRSDFKNADESPVRLAFQKAALE
jgi:hypothetical protein